ncbi:hypothetical protein Tco_0126344, partial [Tanacetum coccineum]
KRLCIALGPRYEVDKSSSAPTARPTRDTWDDMVEDMQGTPAATDVAGLSQEMTYFVTTVRQDTDEICGWSMDASGTARSEVRALKTTVLAQQTEVAALRAADRARQAQLVETLRLMSALQTQVTALQGPASSPAQPKISEEAGSSS